MPSRTSGGLADPAALSRPCRSVTSGPVDPRLRVRWVVGAVGPPGAVVGSTPGVVPGACGRRLSGRRRGGGRRWRGGRGDRRVGADLAGRTWSRLRRTRRCRSSRPAWAGRDRHRSAAGWPEPGPDGSSSTDIREISSDRVAALPASRWRRRIGFGDSGAEIDVAGPADLAKIPPASRSCDGTASARRRTSTSGSVSSGDRSTDPAPCRPASPPTAHGGGPLARASGPDPLPDRARAAATPRPASPGS